MLTRSGFVAAIAVAAFLTGCGGKEEVKKNEGTIVNTLPTAVGAGGGGTTPGAPATNTAKPPPPIPKIVE